MLFLTAGESHGQGLVATLEGMPASLSIDFDAITTELRRRQGGYGATSAWRSIRRAEILSGIRRGRTTGAPSRADHKLEELAKHDARGGRRLKDRRAPIVRRWYVPPRPRISPALKYGHDDIRVLERQRS